MTTSVAAARKDHVDLSVGDIIRSNIFNILAILCISSLISDIAISELSNVAYN